MKALSQRQLVTLNYIKDNPGTLSTAIEVGLGHPIGFVVTMNSLSRRGLITMADDHTYTESDDRPLSDEERSVVSDAVTAITEEKRDSPNGATVGVEVAMGWPNGVPGMGETKMPSIEEWEQWEKDKEAEAWADRDAKGFKRHLRRRLAELVPTHGPAGAVAALSLESGMLDIAVEFDQLTEEKAQAALDSQDFLGWTDKDWEKVPDRDASKGQLPPEVAERLRRNGEEALATVREGLADLGEVPEMSPERARALLDVGLKRQGLI